MVSAFNAVLGLYSKSMVQALSLSICPILVQVCTGSAGKPFIDLENLTPIIFIGVFADIFIVCFSVSPTSVFAQLIESGIKLSFTITLSAFSIFSSSLLVSNNVSKIKTTMNAAANSNHWICFGVLLRKSENCFFILFITNPQLFYY